MDHRLTLGTRGSPLALAQARCAAAAIAAAHGWPTDSVILTVIRTTGDRVQDRPLAEIGGKALWTRELDRALAAGEIDGAVHSLKDVESERPPTLIIAAVLERADVRDRLVGAPSIEALAPGARIGTSSPRRAAQLLGLRPDLRIIALRGNVETRLAKIAHGEADATLLAAAGLDRLGRGEVGSAIAVETILPAPGQAAMAIECRADDEATRALLAAIDHRPSSAAVAAERAFARALGGSCHSPVAALAVPRGAAELWLRGEILLPDGTERRSGEALLAIGDEAGAAALAERLLDEAGAALRSLFGGR